MCSALSLSAETAFVSKSLFQSSIIRGEFQKNYGTGVVTQEVVDRVNQKSTPLPGGGGGPPPPPPPTNQTAVISDVTNVAALPKKAGRVTLYNSKDDGLRILEEYTRAGDARRVGIINAANATVRGGGGLEGAFCSATTLQKLYKDTSDHLLNAAGQKLSVNKDNAGLKILHTKNVRWNGDPSTAAATGFLSGAMDTYYASPAHARTENTTRPTFDVFSVAAVNRGQVIGTPDYNRLQNYMEHLFDMMFAKAASEAVEVMIVPPPGTSIFLGGDVNFGRHIMQALSASIARYRDKFDEIIVPDFHNATIPNIMADLENNLNGKGLAAYIQKK